MHQSIRYRMLVVITMVTAPLALLLLAGAASFWNVHHDVSEQRSRFEIPSDASAARLRQIVQRLDVGPQGTSCGPCVAEMPTLKAIYDRYHSRGFEIIGVPIDGFPGKLIAFLEEHEIDWPQLFDREENLERMQGMGIGSIPSSLLLDRRGRVFALDLRAVSTDPERRLEPALIQLLERVPR